MKQCAAGNVPRGIDFFLFYYDLMLFELPTAAICDTDYCTLFRLLPAVVNTTQSLSAVQTILVGLGVWCMVIRCLVSGLSWESPDHISVGLVGLALKHTSCVVAVCFTAKFASLGDTVLSLHIGIVLCS